MTTQSHGTVTKVTKSVVGQKVATFATDLHIENVTNIVTNVA